MATAGSRLQLKVTDATASYLLPNAQTSFSVALNRLPAIIGREPEADVRLLAPFVSRRHAVIGHNGERWIIRDAGSKLGTKVNELAASTTDAVDLSSGDQIHIGPLVLHVALSGDADPTFNLLMSDTSADRTIVGRDLGGSVAAISEAELSGLAQQRLAVLLRSAARLTEAPDVAALARALTQAASVGTGSPRAIWLSVTGENDWVMLGHFPPRNTDLDELALSRSLVSLARQGKIAELQSEGSNEFGEAMSIEMLNIRSAICAPIQIDNEVVGVLYLDTRGAETPIQRDAAAFCVGLCQLGGMALANLRRAELARKEKEMRDELKAARVAQQQMLPESEGEVGPIRYGLVAVPGMIVAGDMFDIIPLGEKCSFVLLGDVMGKGAAAGLMMATVQTYFRALCRQESDLAQLMSDANAYFSERFKGQGFVTLWIGKFEAPNRLTYVDAGHGHWGMTQTGQGFRELESEGGPPIGAFPSSEYEAGELELPPGARIILYSDGLTEQHDEQGELFETAVGMKCLTESQSANDDVRLLLEAQDGFRKSVPLSDDLTIASIEWK